MHIHGNIFIGMNIMYHGVIRDSKNKITNILWGQDWEIKIEGWSWQINIESQDWGQSWGAGANDKGWGPRYTNTPSLSNYSWFYLKIKVLILHQKSHNFELCKNVIVLNLLSILPEKLHNHSNYITIKKIFSYRQTLFYLKYRK